LKLKLSTHNSCYHDSLAKKHLAYNCQLHCTKVNRNSTKTVAAREICGMACRWLLAAVHALPQARQSTAARLFAMFETSRPAAVRQQNGKKC
jgi:hypothetical protein